MTNNRMTVVGYIRVSTENQLENYSIDEQSERIKAYCAAKGWILLDTYIDGGYSGGNIDRPALQKMLRDICSNHIDAVVVYKLDRLSRSQKDTLTIIEDQLLANQTDFISINENFDTSTPFGRAMIGILSVFAQLEKDQITERFTMGRIGRGKAGYFHGGGNAPTGYDYIDGNLVVNEYEALQIREAYQSFLEGKSINGIVNTLSSKYTTKWTAIKVRNILSNSIYIGKIHFKGKEYAGNHVPIIEAQTYHMAQELLHSEARENKKTTSQKTPFRANYLLSSLVFCARCGARYAANHGCYRCYSRAKSSKRFIIDPNCRNDNWEIEKLDNLVRRQIDRLLSRESKLDEMLQKAAFKEEPAIDTERLQMRIHEIDKQIDKLVELYQVSELPMETLTARINKISSEKQALLKQIESPPAVSKRERFLSAIAQYRERFDESGLEERRFLISSLIERVIIDGQLVKIQWRT